MEKSKILRKITHLIKIFIGPFLLFFVLLVLFIPSVNASNINIQNPYTPKAYSYKGQIHDHTTLSDGIQNPIERLNDYKNAGYNFVSITDHLSVKIKNGIPMYTPNPAVQGILYIPGCEIDTSKNPFFHLGTVNIPINLQADDFKYNSQTKHPTGQEMIKKLNDGGAISIINHPNWQYFPLTNQVVESLNETTGIEIWNSLLFSNSEDKWDFVLDKGRQIWGFADDDCHNSTHTQQCRTSYIKVFADYLTLSEIVTNIKNGNFYAGYTPKGQQDIKILDISTSKNTINIKTDTTVTVEFISTGGITKQKNQNVTSASYTVLGGEKYIRIRMTKGDIKVWTNPMFITSPTPTLSGPSVTAAPTPINCTKKIKGDANCDNSITLTDFEIWRSEFIKNALTKADFNDDRKINLFDFEIWRGNIK